MTALSPISRWIPSVVAVLATSAGAQAADDVKVKLSGEVRERFERRIDRTFSPNTPGNDSELSSRWRLRGDFTWEGPWSATLEYQFESRILWTLPRNFSRGRDDLYQAYAQYQADGKTLRIGRQTYRASTGRVLATSSWGNVGRTFDGVSGTDGTLSLFAFKLGVNSRNDGLERFYGGTYKSPWGETLLFYSFGEPNGLVRGLYTIDHAWSMKRDKWDASAEIAGQLGRSNGKEHRAWAFAGSVGYSPSPQWRVFASLDWASGGEDRDTVSRLDPLYGTTHDLYGNMDLQEWSNTRLLTLGAEWRPTPQWKTMASLGFFALQDPTDGWYNTSGSINRGTGFAYIDPTGRSGRDVGRELNFEVEYNPDPRLQVTGGVGVFFAGSFIKNLNGGQADNQTWGYVQARWRF